MTDFTDADLRDAILERTDLSGAKFLAASMSDTEFRGVDFHNVVMRGIEMYNVSLYGEFENVTINGVEIWPLVNAELNRRYPDRAKMRPTDPAGFREAWDTVERLWAGTVDRARQMPP